MTGDQLTQEADEPLAEPQGEFPVGTTIRRYVVLEKVGEGAMGVVYAAYDFGLDRKVALKLLRDPDRAGIDRARLIREAQALAKLSHPNVVGVYDVGSHGDQVFVAMEFVDGQTLRAWCAAAPRTWREIVAVYCDAGAGLAAAHAAGIVHRDFKPDNVFVDRAGRARVGDFGLAAFARAPAALPEAIALPAAADADAQLTHTGAVMGTPAYMAPEQHRAEPVDARADQFAFAAALYESVCGVRPFAGRGLDGLLAEIVRGELQPPARAVPAWLQRAIARALASDPAHRYPSLDALLRRLRAEPRRRWLRAGAVAGILAAGAAGALAVTAREAAAVEPPCLGAPDKLAGVWDPARAAAIGAAFRASGAPRAEAVWRDVERGLGAHAGQWAAAFEETCRATRVRGEHSEAVLDLRMTCLERRRGELRALGDVFAAADAKVVSRAAGAVDALPSIDICADVPTLSLEVPPPDAARRPRYHALEAQIARATALGTTGKLADGIRDLRALLPEARALGHRGIESAALLRLGKLQRVKREWAAAEATLYDAIAAAEAGGALRNLAEAWTEVANAASEQGRRPEALRDAAIARGVLERIGGDARIGGTLDEVTGLAYLRLGRLADARPLLERALAAHEQRPGAQPWTIAGAIQHLGILARLRHDYRGALARYHRARELDEQFLGPDHPTTLAMLTSEVYALYLVGELDRSLELTQRGLRAVDAKGFGDTDLAVSFTGNLGRIQCARRDPAGLQTLAHARAMAAKLNGSDDAGTAELDADRALAFLEFGRAADAAALLATAVPILERASGADHPELGTSVLTLGRAELALGRARDALAHFERAVAIRASAVPAARAEAERWRAHAWLAAFFWSR